MLTNNKRWRWSSALNHAKNTHTVETKGQNCPPFPCLAPLTAPTPMQAKPPYHAIKKKKPPYHVYTVVMLTTSHNSVENDVSTNFAIEGYGPSIQSMIVQIP